MGEDTGLVTGIVVGSCEVIGVVVSAVGGGGGGGLVVGPVVGVWLGNGVGGCHLVEEVGR